MLQGGRSKAEERMRWEETSKEAGGQETSEVQERSPEKCIVAMKPCRAGALPSACPGGAPEDTSRHQEKHRQSAMLNVRGSEHLQ